MDQKHSLPFEPGSLETPLMKLLKAVNADHVCFKTKIIIF